MQHFNVESNDDDKNSCCVLFYFLDRCVRDSTRPSDVQPTGKVLRFTVHDSRKIPSAVKEGGGRKWENDKKMTININDDDDNSGDKQRSRR